MGPRRKHAPAGSIDWIESPQWHPQARRWLEAHGRMLPPEEGAQGATSLLKARSAAEELAAAADWARNNSRDETFRAWICVPDLAARRSEVIDAFDAALAPQRFNLGSSSGAGYAVAGGSPLSEYAPVRAALALLRASLGAVSFADFSALLRSAELQGSEEEAGSAARLDMALRRRAANEASLAAWLDLAERAAVVDKVGAVPAVKRLRAALLQLSQLRGRPGLSANGARSGAPPSNSLLGRFARAGRAPSISRRNVSENCWPHWRPAMRCSGSMAGSRRNASCSGQRAKRRSKCKPACRESG